MIESHTIRDLVNWSAHCRDGDYGQEFTLRGMVYSYNRKDCKTVSTSPIEYFDSETRCFVTRSGIGYRLFAPNPDFIAKNEGIYRKLAYRFDFRIESDDGEIQDE